MWAIRRAEIFDRVLHFSVDLGPRPATFAEGVRGLEEDAEFRALFNASLAEAPFSAFRWETPPLTAATSTRVFEYVLLDSPELIRRPDPEAFAEHFAVAQDRSAVAFPNLGGDAIMVVPCPIASATCYGHLAAFVRGAPDSQRHALWQLVGAAMTERMGAKPVWLSTAGAGVSWLHVRLDDRPKYYGYGPFTSAF